MAVDPPAAVCEALAAWAREAIAGMAAGARAPAARLLGAGLMHVTLCFLGSRPAGEIEPLCAALAGCEGEECELSLGAPVWLPPRRPHALAIELGDPGGGLARLHEGVVAAMAAAGSWEPERRRLRPHVTVARMRAAAPEHGRRGRARDGGDPAPLPPTPAGAFTARELRLYRSHLSPDGASYELLAACPLAEAQGPER